VPAVDAGPLVVAHREPHVDQGAAEQDAVRYVARKLEEWTGDHEELILAPAVRETAD